MNIYQKKTTLNWKTHVLSLISDLNNGEIFQIFFVWLKVQQLKHIFSTWFSIEKLFQLRKTTFMFDSPNKKILFKKLWKNFLSPYSTFTA